ncbi:MAG: hypothetical protein CSYNP_02010 [Syntrophus sp. SKADARSKE-3]|nr:hypothetical protein [Syntrophus sp. SKADARSKE-3]
MCGPATLSLPSAEMLLQTISNETLLTFICHEGIHGDLIVQVQE